jgi:hypothetical protein
MRGRVNGNMAMVNNGGRMMNNVGMNAQPNGIPQQRSFFLAPIATDQILKRLTVSSSIVGGNPIMHKLTWNSWK